MQVFMKHNNNTMQCKGYMQRMKKNKVAREFSISNIEDRTGDWENDKWFIGDLDFILKCQMCLIKLYSNVKNYLLKNANKVVD